MSVGANYLALCGLLALGEAAGFALSRYAALWPVFVLGALPAALALAAAGVRGLRFFAAPALGFALALHAAHVRDESIAGAPSGAAKAPPPRVFVVERDAQAHAEGEGVRWASFPARRGALAVRVVCPLAAGDERPRAGEEWECAGWLGRDDKARRAGRRTLWVRGAGSYARRSGNGWRNSLARALAAARDDLSRRMGLGLPSSRDADLARAILLGERGRLTRDERMAFVAAGTIHVFAISGLHVMLVAETLAFLLSLTGCPLRGRAFALIPALWLYAALTGLSPSAVRAASMCSFKFAANVFWRRPDGLVSWAITFLAVHAIDPSMLFDTGSALSFAVMLGLVLCGRFVREFVASPLASALVMTFAAWAVGTPIAAHAFGRVTPGGLLANLALIPAAGVGVKVALSGALASFVSDGLAARLNGLAALVTQLMSALSRLVAALPGANVAVEPWSLAVCVEWYAALALLLWLLRSVLSRRRSRL